MTAATERKVYIGNGQTVTVRDNETYVYYLDLHKLKKLFEDDLTRQITVGATSDWVFTAQTIKGKDEFEKILKGNKYLLFASSWSRFSINGEEDCTIEIPLAMDFLVYTHGFQKGKWKIESWIPGIHEKMAKMGYEQLKEFSGAVQNLLSKFEGSKNDNRS